MAMFRTFLPYFNFLLCYVFLFWNVSRPFTDFQSTIMLVFLQLLIHHVFSYVFRWSYFYILWICSFHSYYKFHNHSILVGGVALACPLSFEFSLLYYLFFCFFPLSSFLSLVLWQQHSQPNRFQHDQNV